LLLLTFFFLLFSALSSQYGTPVPPAGVFGMTQISVQPAATLNSSEAGAGTLHCFIASPRCLLRPGFVCSRVSCILAWLSGVSGA
jgi:hypothetical protein